MPYAKRARARRPRKGNVYRRRTYRPRKTMRKRRPLWRNLPIGFPKTHLVRFKYVDTISLNAAAAEVVSTYIFRANDCYDPDYTGTGHQPYGFDQWAAYYEHCHIIGSRCTVQYTPTASAGSTSAAMLVMSCEPNRRDSTTYPSYSAMLEKTTGKHIIVGQQYSNGSFDQKSQKLSAVFVPRKTFKTNIKSYVANPDYACTYTSVTPDANTAWYNINLCQISGGGDPDAMTFTVTIDYICMLSGRLTQPTS